MTCEELVRYFESLNEEGFDHSPETIAQANAHMDECPNCNFKKCPSPFVQSVIEKARAQGSPEEVEKIAREFLAELKSERST